VWFSVVYLGEHYVVDALDGLIYVAAAVLLVEVGRRLLSRRQPAAAALRAPAPAPVRQASGRGRPRY
jgi:hypothetical protein